LAKPNFQLEKRRRELEQKKKKEEKKQRKLEKTQPKEDAPPSPDHETTEGHPQAPAAQE
jgi:hypothetical protein